MILELKQEMAEKRCWREYAKERFLNEIRQMDWVLLYHNYDVSKVCHLLTEKIRQALDIVALVVKIKNRRAKEYKSTFEPFQGALPIGLQNTFRSIII